ncbi:MAG: hypothetical protein ACE5LQ_04955 [Candidatus Bipolaricaulia bacterium]
MPAQLQIQPLITFAMSAVLLTGVAAVGSRALGSSPPKHYSIPWEAKKPLVDKYGLWAVNRAEAFCPEGDVACVEREAKRLIEVYRFRREV